MPKIALAALALALAGCTFIHIEGHDNSITDAGGGLDFGLKKTIIPDPQQSLTIHHYDH